MAIASIVLLSPFAMQSTPVEKNYFKITKVLFWLMTVGFFFTMAYSIPMLTKAIFKGGIKDSHDFFLLFGFIIAFGFSITIVMLIIALKVGDHLDVIKYRL